jgi:hypothetical protein
MINNTSLHPLIYDAVVPPPWGVMDNQELTQKYVDVMRELDKYGYEVTKKNGI